MKEIDQYKNAKLSEKELDDFTGKLIRAKFRKEKKDKWIQQLENDHGIKRPKSKTTNSGRNYFGKYFLAIAASLFFIVIAFLVIRSDSTPPAIQYADNYLQENKFPNSLATKGNVNIPMLELEMAEAYNKENFSEAIKLGEQLIKIEGASAENYFFLGLSYLYTDDFQNAKIALLQFQVNNIEQQFNQESRWFLALTYIKLEDSESAKSELQHIITHKEWNFKQAEQLFKALNR